MKTDTPKTIYLKDYTPPDWVVEHTDLTFRIFPDKTFVRAELTLRKNHDGATRDVVLNGERLILRSLTIDGRDLPHRADEKFLTFTAPGDRFTVVTEVETDPASNTRLEGLYRSGGNWCTQCEPEGFRAITYYPDRPDHLATFRVRIEADKADCPVLLSNGNLFEQGELDAQRHFAVWDDPFPKPCYLFALVAGRLVHIEDRFTTRAGLDVTLRIYVRAGDETQCDFAMASLKRAMKWDEDVYGREYQFSRFNIVAVADYNMGGMENTSLNIFNTAAVLAHPDTGTDADYERVEAVICHEYFHNWTGNRVTCRDWFQLALKEGLTVFREQQFCADMNSADLQRIIDVGMLRRLQFPEDAGPLAHPVAPESYIEINNFYTMTIYEKGSELIRMQRALLGPDAYRKATDLYFDRFDGMAVTIDDFVQCVEDASGQNMAQFKLWYRQAGTPELTATSSYDEPNRRFTLTLAQKTPATPGQPDKQPMVLPVRVGLIGANGHDIDEKLLVLREAEQSFTFENVAARPVPSILRGFSAPVNLTSDVGDDDLRFLMMHDSDGFNRWEAGQTFALRVIQKMLAAPTAEVTALALKALVESFGVLLDQAARPEADRALLARALTLPDLIFLGRHCVPIDPPALHAARLRVARAVAEAHRPALERLYQANNDRDASIAAADRARRSLKNVVLRLLEDAALANRQYEHAATMTDRVGALVVLADLDGPERQSAFEDFVRRFADYPLVVDKWFSLQAAAARPHVIDDVRTLARDKRFSFSNPNRVRSLYSAFGNSNPVGFHNAGGGGYAFVADGIVALNATNPQVAARLMMPFRDWQHYTQDRQALMRVQMQRIAETPDISADVFEIVSKSLGG